MTTQNIKQELNKNMENLRKKNQTSSINRTKTIYDHQATTTEDSTRNSPHRICKQTKPQEDGKYQNTGEEKTGNRE
jgi:hypothetical protein